MAIPSSDDKLQKIQEKIDTINPGWVATKYAHKDFYMIRDKNNDVYIFGSYNSCDCEDFLGGVRLGINLALPKIGDRVKLFRKLKKG